MSSKKSNIVDVILEPRMVKGKAQAFFEGNYEENNPEKEIWIWLPLSQIEVEEITDSQIVEVSLPEWLAKEKGLI